MMSLCQCKTKCKIHVYFSVMCIPMCFWKCSHVYLQWTLLNAPSGLLSFSPWRVNKHYKHLPSSFRVTDTSINPVDQAQSQRSPLIPACPSFLNSNYRQIQFTLLLKCIPVQHLPSFISLPQQYLPSPLLELQTLPPDFHPLHSSPSNQNNQLAFLIFFRVIT